MLVLTRRVGEGIIIHDNISLRILRIQGNQVRIGIKAPREYSVHREEVYQRIITERENTNDVLFDVDVSTN